MSCNDYVCSHTRIWLQSNLILAKCKHAFLWERPVSTCSKKWQYNNICCTCPQTPLHLYLSLYTRTHTGQLQLVLVDQRRQNFGDWPTWRLCRVAGTSRCNCKGWRGSARVERSQNWWRFHLQPTKQCMISHSCTACPNTLQTVKRGDDSESCAAW